LDSIEGLVQNILIERWAAFLSLENLVSSLKWYTWHNSKLVPKGIASIPYALRSKGYYYG
jgi:hypothetical protein